LRNNKEIGNAFINFYKRTSQKQENQTKERAFGATDERRKKKSLNMHI